jgi:hypothetical protein
MKVILSLSMRRHQPTGDGKARNQDTAALGFSDVEALVVGTAIGHVGGGEPFAGADPIERLAQAAENPVGTKTGVSNGKVVLLVYRKAIGPAEAPGR